MSSIYAEWRAQQQEMADRRERGLPSWEQLGLVPRHKRSIVLDETEEGFRAADKLIAELMNYDPYTCLMAAWNAHLTFPEPPPFLTIHMEQT